MPDSADGKQIVNSLYHGAVISALAMGYAQLGKMFWKGSVPQLKFDVKDIAMITADITLATATHDFIINKGWLPADIITN